MKRIRMQIKEIVKKRGWECNTRCWWILTARLQRPCGWQLTYWRSSFSSKIFLVTKMFVFHCLFFCIPTPHVPLTFFSKMFFCKNHLESIPDCQNVFWALYYKHIVVEVTMNMAEYTRSWQSAAGEAKECQYLNQL